MAYVIYGAGAVGGVLGARLAQAGHDVTLIARGDHLAAIHREGLRVESPHGTDTVRLTAVTAPDEVTIGPGDVVVLAMKSQDTAAALAHLRRCADPATPIVCAQNGVANERMALRLFQHVYGVCVMFPAAHLEPGVVQHHSSPVTGLLDLGRYPDGLDDAADRIAADFAGATFVSQPRPDIMRWKYRKLIMNLGNAVHALCRPDDDVHLVLERVRSEAETCLRRAGIEAVSDVEDRDRRGQLLQPQVVGDRIRPGGSTWQSLHRSTGAIETDYLNGEIVLLGRTYAVATPVNARVQQLAAKAAFERRAPGSVPVKHLLG